VRNPVAARLGGRSAGCPGGRHARDAAVQAHRVAVEASGGQAMFRNSAGDVKVLDVGEEYAGMKLISVEESGAKVEFGGKTIFMKKEDGQ
jgi:hypothetical protein